MAKVTVHNVSDRPNTPGTPVSLIIGGRKLRPGQSMVVDDSVLNAKHRELHGTRIWIGDELPPKFVRTSRAALKLGREESLSSSTVLDLEQVREHLSKLDMEALLELARRTTPPVDLRESASKAAIVSRLSRALFHSDRELDPEAFFWLGRWTNARGGFVPVE